MALLQPPSSDGSDATKSSLLLRLKSEVLSERETAWKEFFARYENVVRHFAGVCGVADHDADDVLQEVMHALRKFHYDRAKGRFRNFLFITTRNAIFRFRQINLKHVHGELDELTPDAATTERHWNSVFDKEFLVQALIVLNAEYGSTEAYSTFDLWMKNECCEYASLEQILGDGIKINTITKRINRMKAKLEGIMMNLKRQEDEF